MLLLAIETSCDDTSLSVFRDRELLAMVTRSQIDAHLLTQGVVPEVAARLHSEAVFGTLDEVLEKSGVRIRELTHIAVTKEPWLLPSLLVGRTIAKTLGYALSIPVIEVNHIQAHIFALYLGRSENAIPFPCAVLTVSWGHTEIYLWKEWSDLTLIGQTHDDAAGEAFDKVAKMMGLGYPGGPIISQLAEKWRAESWELREELFAGHSTSQASNLKPLSLFPLPLDDSSLDFSFSGLKSAVKREVDRRWGPLSLTEVDRQEIAYEFQRVVVTILSKKLLAASDRSHAASIALAGGVSANDSLREMLSQAARERGIPFFAPTERRFSMDNAAMVGARAWHDVSILTEKLTIW